MHERPLVINDPQARSFEVKLSTLVDPKVLKLEQR